MLAERDVIAKSVGFLSRNNGRALWQQLRSCGAYVGIRLLGGTVRRINYKYRQDMGCRGKYRKLELLGGRLILVV